MAHTTDAISALLKNSENKQILPVSKADLIELISNTKALFNGNVNSVDDALTYLANAYAFVMDDLTTRLSDLTANGLTYEGNTTIYNKIGELEAEIDTNTSNISDLQSLVENSATSYMVEIDDTTPGEYIFTQNGETIGTISFPEDMVATNGSLVEQRPATTTELENDPNTEYITGTYIEMSIAHAPSFYIDVKDLVDVYTATNGTYVNISVNNNTITADLNGPIPSAYVSYNGTTVEAALTSLWETVTEANSKTAEDITIDNTNFGEGVDNVQEALDALQAGLSQATQGGITSISYSNVNGDYVSINVSGSGTTRSITLNDSALGNVSTLIYDPINSSHESVDTTIFQ